jgi:uncharacterized protein involved in copper resistance
LRSAIEETPAMSDRLLAAEPAFRDDDDATASEALAWLGADDSFGFPSAEDNEDDALV